MQFLLRGVWGVQFQCRLFRFVQALILGALVAFLGVLSGFLLCYLVGCLGFCLVALVQIIAGFGIWAGKSVGMVLLLGPGRRRISVFLDSLLEVFGYPVRSGGLLLAGEMPLRYYSGTCALREPSWSVLDHGGVQALLSAGGSGVGHG